jgi:hypothetical protein
MDRSLFISIQLVRLSELHPQLIAVRSHQSAFFRRNICDMESSGVVYSAYQSTQCAARSQSDIFHLPKMVMMGLMVATGLFEASSEIYIATDLA